MITLETLIKNEIKYHAEHEPTEQEITKFTEMVMPIVPEDAQPLDLDIIISTWCEHMLTECKWCGHKYMPTEMVYRQVGALKRPEFFCCEQCARDYHQDHGGQ